MIPIKIQFLRKNIAVKQFLGCGFDLQSLLPKKCICQMASKTVEQFKHCVSPTNVKKRTEERQTADRPRYGKMWQQAESFAMQDAILSITTITQQTRQRGRSFR